MVVGSLEIHLRLQGCRSLKDKRHILSSLIPRLRSRFEVAAAEVGDNDLWGNAVLGIAAVGNNAAHVENILQSALSLVESHPEVEIEAITKNLDRT